MSDVGKEMDKLDEKVKEVIDLIRSFGDDGDYPVRLQYFLVELMGQSNDVCTFFEIMGILHTAQVDYAKIMSDTNKEEEDEEHTCPDCQDKIDRGELKLDKGELKIPGADLSDKIKKINIRRKRD